LPVGPGDTRMLGLSLDPLRRELKPMALIL
jgi:hypothetical protein